MSARIATILGLAAIVLWASTIGLARLLTEPLGPLMTGAVIFTLGGLLGCLRLLRRAPRAELARWNWRHVAICGALNVFYVIALYLAIGLASGRPQVLEVGIINYLWPSLTLLLSVPLLGRRARPALPLGVIVAFGGIVLAIWPSEHQSLPVLVETLRQNAWPYLLALAAAVSWGTYSNLANRWPAGGEPIAVSLYMLMAGIIAAGISLAMGQYGQWSWNLVLPAAYLAIFPGVLAYSLWGLAMRGGNVTVIASAAQITPLLSTLFSCAMLAVLPGSNFWLGCAMVAAGAAIGARGVK